MRSLACLGVLCLAFVASAQDFEVQTPTCSAVFPLGCGTTGDPEGISANGNALATIDTANGAGFPTNGLQYGRVAGFGPFSSPAGGPMPEPGVSGGNQMYIPVPAGATTVTFQWDFYNAEGGPSASFNDGMSIDVVGAGCTPGIAALVYADTNTAAGTGSDSGAGCGIGATERAPNGPNSFVGSLPSGAASLRVTVWNGGDNAVTSHGVIDNVIFGFGQVPCVLQFTSPTGPGSLQIDNTQCAASAGRSFLMGVTLVAGTFPGGWYGGLDITLTDLVAQFNAGFPFSGTLDGGGASTLFVPGGVPSGINLFAVTGEFAPGFGAFQGFRAPASYTTP